MSAVLFELAAAPGIAGSLAEQLGCEAGELERRAFPDGETYLRFATEVAGKDVILLCSLDQPDSKVAALLLAADAARQQKARSVGLVAPYLAYMRQDKQFRPGEAVTSTSFAKLLSSSFDWLVTVDPHLHRYSSLSAIYTVPAVSVSAAPRMAEWIKTNVDNAVLVGPDEESAQWVGRVAEMAQARFCVLRKERAGDYSVSIDPASLSQLGSGTPVIVDDIASSARTLIEAAKLIQGAAGEPPVCAVVHGIFAGDAHEQLLASGVRRVASTNTVPHLSNSVDITSELATGIMAATRVSVPK